MKRIKLLGILCVIALTNIRCDDREVYRLNAVSDLQECSTFEGDECVAVTIGELRARGALAVMPETAEEMKLKRQEYERELEECRRGD